MLVPSTDLGFLAPDAVPHTTRTSSRSSTRYTARASEPSGTSTPSWTPTPTARADSAELTTFKTAITSTASILPVTAESHPIDHSGKTWQIIGIVIIAILFVATSITCAMFFDRLWRFFKDAVCCATRPLVSDELVQDCEKQIWDTRTLSPSPSDFGHHDGEFLREELSVYTTRARELPWNTDALQRQPSRRNDHPPTV